MMTITLLPLLGWLVLPACLRLLHSPWLTHMLAIAEFMPSASELGPNPGLVPLQGALHFCRRYFAAVSLGLDMYVRWPHNAGLCLTGKRRSEFSAQSQG
jgi:hypothetical protein